MVFLDAAKNGTVFSRNYQQELMVYKMVVKAFR